MPTIDVEFLSPCDVVCGACTHCRIFNALRMHQDDRLTPYQEKYA